VELEGGDPAALALVLPLLPTSVVEIVVEEEETEVGSTA